MLSPKTEKSRRVVPLIDIALEALMIQKQRQEEIKQKYQLIYDDKDFVFARYDGRCLEQGGFMKKYHAFLEKYGLPSIRFHDLRHPYVKHKLKNLSDYWPDRLSAKDKPARPVFLLSFQVLFMLSQSLNP